MVLNIEVNTKLTKATFNGRNGMVGMPFQWEEWKPSQKWGEKHEVLTIKVEHVSKII